MSQDLAISSERDLTLDLATFYSNLQYEDLPDKVFHIAKASILNSIGCGLSAVVLEPWKKMFAALDVAGKEPRPATILTCSERGSVEDATMLNGLAMTARFFDDTHLGTVVHPSGPPLAAALAYAEAYHLSGKDVLLAFVVGVEAMLAVAAALGLGPYKRGWHLTSMTGTFGATVAIAKLMALSSDQTANAIGHASSMAAGTRGVFGTDTLIMHAGRAAQNGLLSARLAKEDFGSTTHALEKWIKLIGDEDSDTSLLSPGMAKERRWMILDNTFKPYPCGIVIHPSIDAGIAAHDFFFAGKEAVLKEQSPQDALDIFSSIEATVTPLTMKLCGVKHPTQFMQTIFSTYHGLACALLSGRAGIREFSMEIADLPWLKALRDRITFVTDESFADDQASVKIKYNAPGDSQQERTFTIEHASGSLLNPMTDDQLAEKFKDQATVGGITEDIADSTLEQLWTLESVDRVQSIMKNLVPVSET